MDLHFDKPNLIEILFSHDIIAVTYNIFKYLGSYFLAEDCHFGY